MMMQKSGLGTLSSSKLSRSNVVHVAAYHGQHNDHHHNNHHNNHHGHNHNSHRKFRDSAPLRDLKVKQNKHILSTYNKAYAFFPKVKFIMKHNSRLGDVWKLSGSTAELGNWNPELSPSLAWREGGVWSAEVALPPGHYSFKCMLRTGDGTYVWESGDNRTITVPQKDRPGHFVMTYDMDVRIEPVETLMGGKQQGQAGQYSPMGAWNNGNQQEQFERERAMSNNGRVHANAW